MRKIFYLFLTLVAILLLPYLGAWCSFNGVFPEGYFDYPSVKAPPKAEFSLWYFIPISIVCIGIVLFYIFPRWFGFKKPLIPAREPITRVAFPPWFWVGLAMWGITLTVLWGHFSQPKWLLNWADLPLFWGITLILDGIVYKRTGGKSIIGTRPKEIIGIGVASIPAWMLFEYLNFFVESNWIYPAGHLIPNTEFLLYAFLGSSGLMPITFEMYDLLRTFHPFKYKYSAGPKIRTGPVWKVVLLLIALAGLFVTGYFPNNLFFLLWLAPVTIFIIVLEELDIWTPFRLIKEKGDWSPVVLFAITYVFSGLLLECQNYFSAVHIDGVYTSTFNPSFWMYSIPYVNAYHVFEMPLLGYFGYIPFSIYCWIWWILFGYLLDVPSRYRELHH